jgi:predicted Fe-Mo cluster-binding NifX family protein
VKVCIPSMEDKGLEGMPHGHFGSCAHFVIHDTETGATDVVGNEDSGHEHGMCHPLGSLEGRSIDAIVVGGIGMRALTRLNAGGMRVYRSAPGTIRENIELLKGGTLEEVKPGDACGHHGGGHGCGG